MSQRDTTTTDAGGAAGLFDHELAAASARRALFEDALRTLEAQPDGRCPVCGNPDASLAARLERETSALETAEISRLKWARQAAREALAAATAAVSAIESVEKRGDAAAASLVEAIPVLRASLGIVPGADLDALAHARVAMEAVDRDIAGPEDTWRSCVSGALRHLSCAARPSRVAFGHQVSRLEQKLSRSSIPRGRFEADLRDRDPRARSDGGAQALREPRDVRHRGLESGRGGGPRLRFRTRVRRRSDTRADNAREVTT